MCSDKNDQNFDAIANKFEKNIYGTSKGRLRHELLLYHLNRNIDFSTLNSALDAGGGTGEMSLVLLDKGLDVTLSDISNETLEIARQKCQNSNTLTLVLSDILGLAHKQYDLVVCHAVLEWLHDPYTNIQKLIAMTKVGGYFSLTFFNKDAQLMGNLLYGNFDYVRQGMKVKNQVRLSPDKPLQPKVVLDFINQQNVTVISMAGIRCFHDYLKHPDMQQTHYEQLKEAEMTFGTKEPFMWLGKYFHILMRRVA
ncbi:methyltransferase domain-containing protein [Paraglaciecola polaris]|uniref:tRNA 5-carboxymethoxyuridine methyltransferase n=1 Tax=Paraglaciecola polaris LMG 21857 TaxID=1129793 RepID=K6YH26_9ALTE|nr:methyltransferase domain-containing protein [Paraglaciecola polaris]GAC32039.1 S-adenosylmethionine-dependent methyltransferase [Paraglaciecola polaris LMG 21857]